MQEADIQQLLPHSSLLQPLCGLYLDLALHQQAKHGDVFIYSNYIASLDGRIALRDAQRQNFSVPQAIANARDWRLYQELAAQSDIMLTSARYFRQLSKGCAQDLLPVGREKAYEDLQVWRHDQGLKPQPDVMILSASLDIPLASLDALQDRKIWLVTNAQADDHKVRELQSAGVAVLQVAEERVQGKAIKALLIEHGYRSAYMIAGPQVHQTMLADQVLNRLFLTTHLSLLGQDAFYTILQGSISPVMCEVESLYWDAVGKQMFAQYVVNPH